MNCRLDIAVLGPESHWIEHPMINYVLIITLDGRAVFRREYMPRDLTGADLKELVAAWTQLQAQIGSDNKISIHVRSLKFLCTEIGAHLLLVLAVDPADDDVAMRERLTNARAFLLKHYSHEIDAYIAHPDPRFQGFEKFRQDLEGIVVTPLKICFLGQGGVGKSTMVKLLTSPNMSKSHDYEPTVGGKITPLQGVRFGPHELALWDFAGQDRFRTLWPVYLRNADVVLVVTDSTLKNVLESRGILETVRKESPSAVTWAIANKQDMPGALAPLLVKRVLGVPSYGLVAIDPRSREVLYNILMGAIAEAATEEAPAASLQRISPPNEPPAQVAREPDQQLRDGHRVDTTR